MVAPVVADAPTPHEDDDGEPDLFDAEVGGDDAPDGDTGPAGGDDQAATAAAEPGGEPLPVLRSAAGSPAPACRTGTATRGTRLPDGWEPARSEANLRVEAGHSQAWLADQLERFRDYWAAQPGAKGRKADWDATWRNWVRRADDPATSLSRRQQETDAQYARARQRAASGVNPLLELIKQTA